MCLFVGATLSCTVIIDDLFVTVALIAVTVLGVSQCNTQKKDNDWCPHAIGVAILIGEAFDHSSNHDESRNRITVGNAILFDARLWRME